MNLAGHQSPGAQEKLKSALDYDTNHVSSSEPPGRPSSLKLSCMTGFIGASHQTLLCHPILSDIYIIAIGPVVVISNLSEPNQQRFLRGHHQNIAVVSISLTGKYIASGEISSSGALKPSICLWDFYSGVLSSRFGSTRGQMKLVEFSSDDRWIAAWSDDNILNIWETESGDLVLVAPRQQYSCMKFGPAIPSNRSRRNPSYLLYACVQNSVLILTFHYDIKTMQYEMSSRRCDLPGRCALIRTFTCCTLDHDNSHLICGSSTGDICIFHVGLGQYKSSFQVCSGGVRSIVLFDDILLVGGGDGVLYKFGRTGQEWMLNTQKKLLGSVTNLSLTSDKKEILSGTNQSCIYRSRVSDLESLLIQRSSPGLISQIAFPSDPGLCLAATISSSGSVLVWDLADLSIISSYQGSSPGSSIVFISGSKIDSNGSHALTGWDDGSIQLYSVSEERMLWQIYDAGRGAIIALQQYQDIIAVAGSKSGAIRIWNKSTRAMLSEYVAHSCFPIIDVILDKTRPHLIHSLGPDKRLVSYDYCKKLYMSGHQLDGSAYQAISQRQQGEHEIAAGLTDGRILIYDLDLSDPVYIHESRSSKPVTVLSFSSDGHYLATIEAPDQIIVYEFTSQQNLRYIDSIFLHSSKIVSVSFTPDKQQIVCICEDSSMSVISFSSCKPG